MLRGLVIALCCLLACGCGPSDIAACQAFLEASPEGFGRGAVVVRFKDSVLTEAEATRAVESASFSVIAFYASTAPLYALVQVPDRGECSGIERLRAHPAIEDSFLQVIVYAR